MPETQPISLDKSVQIEGEGGGDGADLPSGPDLPNSTDVLLVKTFNFPKTPAEFRAILGLSEPPSIFQGESYEEKRRKVEKHADEHTVSVLPGLFRNGQQNLEYQDRRIEKQLADQSLPTRIWRGWVKRRLSWAGVKHGDELLQTIEKNVWIHNRKDLDPSTLTTLLKTLDPQDETEALKKLELAFDRARQFYLVPNSVEFKQKGELIDFIGVLGNTPDDNWQKIYRQFNGRTDVIYYVSSFCSGFGDSKNNGLLQIIKQGGLTAEQDQTLTKATVWGRFAGAFPFLREASESKDKSYKYWLDYNDLLDPTVVGPQLDK